MQAIPGTRASRASLVSTADPRPVKPQWRRTLTQTSAHLGRRAIPKAEAAWSLCGKGPPLQSALLVLPDRLCDRLVPLSPTIVDQLDDLLLGGLHARESVKDLCPARLQRRALGDLREFAQQELLD